MPPTFDMPPATSIMRLTMKIKAQVMNPNIERNLAHPCVLAKGVITAMETGC